MNVRYSSRAVADEIQELVERHQLDGEVVAGGIAIILAEYGLLAEKSGLMTGDQLIDQIGASAKLLLRDNRKASGSD